MRYLTVIICGNSEPAPPAGGGNKEMKQDVKVCTACGEVKGSEKCCKQGAEKCQCGMNKGSIGCCKKMKPAPGKDFALLCGACGEVKGSDKCCKEGATRCQCGMIKGSPGCCKMPK